MHLVPFGSEVLHFWYAKQTCAFASDPQVTELTLTAVPSDFAPAGATAGFKHTGVDFLESQ
jgi:hypothetical protein